MARVSKISKSTKRRLSIFGLLSMGCIFYFLFCLGYELYQVHKLEFQKIELKEEYNNLKKDAKKLQLQIDELNNPEYLAKYARENYSYSKEGEYIIKLKSHDEKIKKVDKKINTNYIYISLSAFVILILFILVVKSSRKNKN